MTKTLPKYAIDTIVLTTNGQEKIKVANKATIRGVDRGWYYNGTIPEWDITHILNAGYWVPVDQWNALREYDAETIAKDMYDEMMYEDPDEQEFIEEQKKIFKESKELRDDKDQATEDA